MRYIKIPKNTTLIYDQKKNFLLLKKNINSTLLQLKLKIIIDLKKEKLFVTNKSTKKVANNEKKNLNSLQKLTAFKIAQTFFDLSIIYYQKLKFVGVGYRAIKLNYEFNKDIFLLKLGLSHSLYLNSTNNVFLYCLKFTKLFVSCNSYTKLTQATSVIRLKKWPEPYKGKGILFNNEKINLKEGKKI